MGLDPKKIFMVSVMPCIAKKYEIRRTGNMFASGEQDVNVSITTRELVRMIRQAGIAFSELDCLTPADSPLGAYSGAGTIFGATGGVMEAALRSAHYFLTGEDPEGLEFSELHGLEGVKDMRVEIGGEEVRVAVAHGLANVERLLRRVRESAADGGEPAYHFVEVMACPGGCLGGGGQSYHVDDSIRRLRIEGLLNDDRSQDVRYSHRNPAVRTLYDEFIGEVGGSTAHEYLHTHYEARPRYQR
jgi:NADH-quinone oxidoreductase subunit G